MENELENEREQRLADCLVRGKVVPFIGSGLSCNVDLPSWGKVVQSMEKEIGSVEGEDFFDTAQRFETMRERKELICLLDRELHLDGVNTEKLDVHHAILDFRFLDIFTTNQDLVLEAVLENLHVPHVPIRCHEDLRTAKALAFPRIVKFHGDLIRTEEIVFTKRDIERRMKDPHPFDIYLQGRLIENAILFIGYSLNDPNVKRVWQRVRKHSTPGCGPIGFRLLLKEDEAEIERMLQLGIEPVVVPVADRQNPVELLEWLHQVRSRAHASFYQASLEYLFHGRLAPARTLARSQLEVIEKELKARNPPDDLLKETVYYQRIPQTLCKNVEQTLLEKIETVNDFVWMWEVAFKERMGKVAAAVLSEMHRRQTTSRSSMFENSQSATMIIHHFDEWTMKIVMTHLEELKSDIGFKETLYHHVVNIFDILRYCLTTLTLSEQDKQTFDLLRHFYESKYPVIQDRWNLPVSRLNARQRLTDGMRRSHVYVAAREDDIGR